MYDYQEVEYRRSCFEAMKTAFVAVKDARSPLIEVEEGRSLDDFISEFVPRFVDIEAWGGTGFNTFDFLTTPDGAVRRHHWDYGLSRTEAEWALMRFSAYTFADQPEFREDYFKARKGVYRASKLPSAAKLRRIQDNAWKMGRVLENPLLSELEGFGSVIEAQRDLREIEKRIYSAAVKPFLYPLTRQSRQTSTSRKRELEGLRVDHCEKTAEAYSILGSLANDYRIARANTMAQT